MNGRQAAKLAAKKIEELEHYNGRCRKDISAYNKVILGLISGELDPCDWCEEKEECQRECKGKGCGEWWLSYKLPVEEDQTDDSDGIPFVGSTGGA